MLDSAVRHSVGLPSSHNPRKLRDSCTDCASSKVKCSREKPTCARCARRGVTCTYMVSRRTGRNSSNASKGDAQIWPAAVSLGDSARPTRNPAISGNSRVSTGNDGNSRPSTVASVSASGNNFSGLHNLNDLTNLNNDDNQSAEICRPSLRVGTPLLSHPATTVSVPHGSGHQDLDPGPGSGPESDLWSSILSPSALMADPAELSLPLTTIDTNVGDLFDLGLHSPIMIDCPEQPSTAENRAHDTTSDLFSDMISVSDPDSFSASHTRTTSAPDWALQDKPPNCCFTVALDILTRLFPNAPSGCTLPESSGIPGSRPVTPITAGPPARTIESVISENKQVIESLTKLLDCHCSQDEYLVSIMTLIALKVMGWYSAAATDVSTSSSPSAVMTAMPSMSMHPPQVGIISSWPGSTSGSGSTFPTDRGPSSSSSGTGPLGEQVLRLPATVGNYCVAGQHQGRMAAQLVLSELHRVQKLVNALSKRLETVRLRTGRVASSESSSGTSSVGEAGDIQGMDFGVARAPPISVPTFSQLEEDLRKRLRVLSSETIDVLRRA